MSEKLPLSGVNVLEQCGWNGVLTGRLLAEAGAHVIRAFPKNKDPLDSEPPFFGDSEISIQSTWFNAGKQLFTLADGVQGEKEFLELVNQADILIEDWGSSNNKYPDDLLQNLTKDLVHLAITPMGLEGPWANISANDLILGALSGGVSITGTSDKAPLNSYGYQTYNAAGFYGAISALAAMRLRDITAQPQKVDLSIHEAMVTCTEQILMQWFFPEGRWDPVAKRQGSLHWSGGYEVDNDRNGRGVMVTSSLGLQEALIPWLNETGFGRELADKEKFPDLISLVKKMPLIMETLRNWVSVNDAEELFSEGQARRLPFGAVWNIGEAVQSAQAKARKYFKDQSIPNYGVTKFPGNYFRITESNTHLQPAISSNDLWKQSREKSGAQGKHTNHEPLQGIRILDFTHVLAGPFGTRILADLGAEVIRVGTASRNAGANNPQHPYYNCWNRNKKSVSIDISTEQGKEAAQGLAGNCDIIIENFSAGVLARWGLDYQSLAPNHPRLSVISMAGMGSSGPWSDFVTFAPTIHALTGLTWATNYPEQHDVGLGYSMCDHLSGLAASLGALEVLEHREKTGKGLPIDLSQYEIGLATMAPAYLDYFSNNHDLEPSGNRDAYKRWAPQGIYPCQGIDRWIAIAIETDEQWVELCALMNKTELVKDSRFQDLKSRLKNQNEIDGFITEWTITQERYAIMELCQSKGLPAGVVQDGADLGENDPQLQDRGFFRYIESEALGKHLSDVFPARFNGQPLKSALGAHALGSDTFDVFTNIVGFETEKVADLITQGILS
jgi:crotonobetainyl-CoA:carnitine CoA-transferase CaiB-like acyl-CoA transferase